MTHFLALSGFRLEVKAAGGNDCQIIAGAIVSFNRRGPQSFTQRTAKTRNVFCLKR